MNFTSYAQNLEDVMLWRALRHIESGFYIDVGANDPVIDSVTKAFYDRGWHGINIEPLPSHHADLVRERPRDINLQCAVGAENGDLEIWECDVRGWATASADVISQHSRSGHEGTYHKVPMYQLSELCTQHASSPIHFLKIDVEGFEQSVIDGMDFSRFRPWIVVIEATRPNSTDESYAEWEVNVLCSGYSMAYMDGLNRFYVADEHPELVNSLRYPPNVFDGYIRSQQIDSEMRAQEAECKAQEAECKAQEAECKAQEAECKAQEAECKAQEAECKAQEAECKAQEAECKAQEAESKAQEAESKAQEAESKAQQGFALAEQAAAKAEHYHAQLIEVYTSTSWRITKPLRWSMDHLRGLKRLRFQGRVKQLSQSMLLQTIRSVGERPRLKRTVIKSASTLGVSGLLRRLYSASKAPVGFHHGLRAVPQDLKQLTPHARRIYADLKIAIEAHQEDQR